MKISELRLYGLARLAAAAMLLIYGINSGTSLFRTMQTPHSSSNELHTGNGISEYIPISKGNSGYIRILTPAGDSIALTCPHKILNGNYICPPAEIDWSKRQSVAAWLNFGKGIFNHQEHRAIFLEIDKRIVFQASPKEVYDSELSSDINSIVIEFAILIPLVLFFNFTYRAGRRIQ
jgi:hypothetical protein